MGGGDLVVPEGALLLAPMAGFTNAPMRMVAREFGAWRTFTEMVSAEGLKYRSQGTFALLESLPEERDCVAHLYGADPESLGAAAEEVSALGRFVGLDLNAGCPVPHVTKCGAGSALIGKPKLIEAIVRSMVKRTDLPVTVKTRLGPHPQDVAVFDTLAAVEAGGGAALSVHARFTSQGHSGFANLDLLAEVKQRAGIPVFGNGGVLTAADVARMRATGVDGVMVARGAFGNPWIFCGGGERPALEEVRRVLVRHVELERAFRERLLEKGLLPAGALDVEDGCVAAFRCHLFRYLKGLHGVTALRSRLNEYRSLDEVMAAVERCLEQERVFRLEREGGV